VGIENNSGKKRGPLEPKEKVNWKTSLNGNLFFKLFKGENLLKRMEKEIKGKFHRKRKFPK